MMEKKENTEKGLVKQDVKLEAMDALSIINSKSMIAALKKSSVVPPNSKDEDIIGCILTGQEFNISPMKSLLQMNILTPSNAPKIIKGLALGMDMYEAAKSIFIIENQVIVGANALIAALRRNGIDVELIKDCEQILVKTIVSGEYKGVELTKELESKIGKENFHILSGTEKQSDIDKIKLNNPNVLFYMISYDYETVIKFTRKGFKDHIRSYKYSRAKESKIIYAKDGKTIKKNWLDKATMMQHKCLGMGGRFIGGDIVGQVYTPGEALEIDENISFIETDR